MAYYRTNLAIGSVTAEATEKQIAFCTSLYTQVNDQLTRHADTPQAEAATAIILGSQDAIAATLAPGARPSKAQASSTITALKAALEAFKSIVIAEQRAAHPGLPANAERTISNRFDPKGGCSVCHESVPAETGFAVLVNGSWSTFCATCADADPAERQARLQAEAEAERQAAVARLQAAKDERDALRSIKDRLVALTGSDTKDHAIRVAIPGTVLDVDNSEAAYRLSWGATTGVERHTGAPGTIRKIDLVAASGLKVAEYVLSLSDDEFFAVQAAYGQHFGLCGRCGSPLSDDDSKARGLGPTCYGRFA